MAVIVVTRWKGTHDHTALVKKGAAVLKRHGAMSVRAGRVFSGAYAGEVTVVTTFADWAAFARTGQATFADSGWQKYQTDMNKAFELQDRSITVSEDY
jgi:hypothetical protein